MRKEAKVGIFMVGGVILIILLYLWMSHFRVRREGYEAILHSPNVTGLKVNDAVMIHGVEKGKVLDLEYYPEYVEVKIWLDKDVVLYKDAHASIKDVAMISGTKFVDLEPGVGPEKLPPGTPIPTEPSVGLPLSDIARMVRRLYQAIEQLNVGGLASDMSEVADNLNTMINMLKDIINVYEGRADTLVETVQSAANRVNKLSNDLHTLTARVDSILDNLQRGEGTLGKLMVDDSLYQELLETNEALQELITDIKKNPYRYIRISIF